MTIYTVDFTSPQRRQTAPDHPRRPVPRRCHDHADTTPDLVGIPAACHPPTRARANRSPARRIHRRSSSAYPERAWLEYRCWRHLPRRQRPVSSLLRQAQEPQGATARGRHDDRQAGLGKTRSQSHQSRTLARSGAHRGSHLQRQGRVALPATGTGRGTHHSVYRPVGHIRCTRCSMNRASTMCSR
jgi:hypothetical protein